VRTVGIVIAFSVIAIITWLGWTADSGALFGPLMSGGAIVAVFYGLPFSLHFGYFWGTTFATIIGSEADPRLEVGEPPRLT
jgi:hypothetical protein